MSKALQQEIMDNLLGKAIITIPLEKSKKVDLIIKTVLVQVMTLLEHQNPEKLTEDELLATIKNFTWRPPINLVQGEEIAHRLQHLDNLPEVPQTEIDRLNAHVGSSSDPVLKIIWEAFKREPQYLKAILWIDISEEYIYPYLKVLADKVADSKYISIETLLQVNSTNDVYLPDAYYRGWYDCLANMLKTISGLDRIQLIIQETIELDLPIPAIKSREQEEGQTKLLDLVVDQITSDTKEQLET